MIKKILTCIGLFSTIILSSLFLTAAPIGNKSNNWIYSVLKEFDKGNLTKAQINSKYPKIFEIVTLSGQAFHYRYQIKVDSAKITLLERPFKPAITTDSEGKWTMKILKLRGVKQECSFILKHPLFPECQTGVIDVYDSDISDITFQIPDNTTFSALKIGLEAGISQKIGSSYTIDNKNTCQIFTTLGKSWASMLYKKFPHGEPDSSAIISPAISFPAVGPIYFNEQVIPDPSLSKTSKDGGILYTNVPTGTYTITGSKEGVTFKTVKVKARPGIIINASPPYGIQGDQE